MLAVVVVLAVVCSLAVAAVVGGHLYKERLEDICPILAVAAVVGGHLYNEFGGHLSSKRWRLCAVNYFHIIN